MVVVGAGSSAYDIGREIALVAKRVYQSVRSSDTRSETPWEKVVHSIYPDNFLQIPEIASFGPTSPPEDIQYAEISLFDNSILSGIDFVIFCTGYRFSLPFLPSYQGKTANLETIITDGVQLHNLHKDMFFIDDPTLAFVGVPYEIATFAFFDIQALAIAAAFSETARLPSKQKMRQEYEKKKLECGTGKRFHVIGMERELQYIKDALDWVNGSSDQPKVVGYEETLRYVEQNQLKVLREILRSSRILHGRDPTEVEEVIARKAEELEQELEKARTAHE